MANNAPVRPPGMEQPKASTQFTPLSSKTNPPGPDPNVLCSFCAQINPPINNLQRRIAVGFWAFDLVCEEHRLFFENEPHPSVLQT